MLVQGLDISTWQDPKHIDLDALYAAGYRFIIVRATYGRSRDRHVASHVKAIRQHGGFRLGAYHFFRQTVSPQEQIAAYGAACRDLGILREGDLFPALDVEGNEKFDGKVSPRLYNAGCDAIADWMRANWGGCIIYTASYFPQILGGGAPYKWAKAPAKLRGAYEGTPPSDDSPAERDAMARAWLAEQCGEAGWIHDRGNHAWLADWNREDGSMRTPFGWDEFNSFAKGGPDGPNGGVFGCRLHQPKPKTIPEYRRGGMVIDTNAVTDLTALTIGGPLALPTQSIIGGTEPDDRFVDENPTDDTTIDELRSQVSALTRALESRDAVITELMRDIQSHLAELSRRR